jgi:hypothetical protein
MCVALTLDVADIDAVNALMESLPLPSGADFERTVMRLGPWLPFSLMFERQAAGRLVPAADVAA